MGGHDYVREQPTGESAEIEPEVQAKIDALLAQRLGLKKARRFDEADGLQRTLYDSYGVEVDDRARTWTVTERAQTARRPDASGDDRIPAAPVPTRRSEYTA